MNFQQKVNAMAPYLEGGAWGDPAKRPDIARRAARLGFKDLAYLIRAYHRAQAAEDREPGWYALLEDLCNPKIKDEDILDRDHECLTAANLPKWRQAARAICPEGPPDDMDWADPDGVKFEMRLAAKIRDPKIRRLRRRYIKIMAASIETFNELDGYINDQEAFICPCCESEVRPQR